MTVGDTDVQVLLHAGPHAGRDLGGVPGDGRRSVRIASSSPAASGCSTRRVGADVQEEHRAAQAARSVGRRARQPSVPGAEGPRRDRERAADARAGSAPRRRSARPAIDAFFDDDPEDRRREAGRGASAAARRRSCECPRMMRSSAEPTCTHADHDRFSRSVAALAGWLRRRRLAQDQAAPPRRPPTSRCCRSRQRLHAGRRRQQRHLQVEPPRGRAYPGTYLGAYGVLLVDTRTAEASDRGPRRRSADLAGADPLHHQHPHPRRSHGRQRDASAGSRRAAVDAPRRADDPRRTRTCCCSWPRPPAGQRQPPQGAMPTDAYLDVKEIWFNGESIQVIHQPAAHTDGDSIVYFRRSDVISAGDIFSTTSYPVIDAAARRQHPGRHRRAEPHPRPGRAGDQRRGRHEDHSGHGRLSDEARRRRVPQHGRRSFATASRTW